MSTTDYSLRGCWGFIPPFDLGLPNYPSQTPFRRGYGGYRFSRRGITSLRTDISSSRQGTASLRTDISSSRQGIASLRTDISSSGRTFPPFPDRHFPHHKHPPPKITPSPTKKGQPSRITLSVTPASADNISSTGNITFHITIIYTITGNIPSTITASSACRPLHNLNPLLSQHLETYILKFELLDLAAAG